MFMQSKACACSITFTHLQFNVDAMTSTLPDGLADAVAEAD